MVGKKDPPTEKTLQQMTDEDLVKQVQKSLQGQTAFAELYRRHVNQVYRYLMARTGHEQDAQDLTAQTFLAAMEALKTFQGRSKFSTWLLSIARRRLADHFRRRRPLEPIEQAEALADGLPLPDEAIEQQLRLETILKLLPILSADRAEALALHSFSGLSVSQVAEIMEKSEAAVRMLIHRAIRDLQQRLRVETQEQVR